MSLHNYRWVSLVFTLTTREVFVVVRLTTSVMDLKNVIRRWEAIIRSGVKIVEVLGFFGKSPCIASVTAL